MKANSTPPDLWHILKRRRVAFERWCDEHNIKTLSDFNYVVMLLETRKEYHISQDMRNIAQKVLPSVVSAITDNMVTSKKKQKEQEKVLPSKIDHANVNLTVATTEDEQETVVKSSKKGNL